VKAVQDKSTSGVTVSDLLEETLDTHVQVGGSAVGLSYRVLWEEFFSDDDWSRVKDLGGREYLKEVLPRLLVSWELQDATGKPIAITAEAIEAEKVPTRFLRLAEQAVLQAGQAPKGGASS
jgi:hypothetical protein